MNNCNCAEHNLTNEAFLDLTITQSVKALVEYNFTGLKLDGCECCSNGRLGLATVATSLTRPLLRTGGPANNLSRWAEVINASGHAVSVENCHWGQTVPHGKPPDDSLGVGPDDDGYCLGLDTPSECPYVRWRCFFRSVALSVSPILKASPHRRTSFVRAAT